MALVEIVILLIWPIFILGIIAFSVIIGVIGINALFLVILGIVKLKRKIPKIKPDFKIFDKLFAPAIWAINEMDEEK